MPSSAAPAPADGKSGTAFPHPRRRAASCSPEWRPEPVEEENELEGEDPNALGLEFGMMQARAARVVQSAPHRRTQLGHRLAASEGVAVAVAA